MLDPSGAPSALDDGQDIAQRKQVVVMIQRDQWETDPFQQILEAHIHPIQEHRHAFDRLGANERDVGQCR
jgi:hypothetical protein